MCSWSGRPDAASSEPDRPLTIVDVHDTPGQVAVLPLRKAGSMECNLGLSNMSFHDFITPEGTKPWWKDS